MSNGNGKDKIVIVSQDDINDPVFPVGRINQNLSGQFRHYLGHGGRYSPIYRPKCRLPGCYNKLKKNDILACCQEHEDLLVHQAKWILSIHRGVLEIEVE